MESILTNVGLVVTSAVGWIGDYLTMITASGNEILLLFVLLPMVGLGIGLLRRLMSV